MNTAITIASGQGDYEVQIVPTIEQLVAQLRAIKDARFVVDAQVTNRYQQLLDDVQTKLVLAIPANESEKTLQGVERVCRFLQGTDASKRSRLVVIGGGITQDIGAFAAHLYFRGIPYTLVPTTLLSMADSCIGAKCGVNLGESKNQLGFFYSPAAVLIWTGFTTSLVIDDIRSGFGEILKLAITQGEAAFARIEHRLNTAKFSLDALDQEIMSSLAVKRNIIERDEYENGPRKTLNYGHTFSHALEGLTEHEVPHGLGVAWGIDVANYIAFRSGLLERSVFERIHNLVSTHFRFDVARPYDADGLLRLIKRDKKAASGSVLLVLLRTFGDLQLVPTTIDTSLQKLVAEYLEGFDVFNKPRLNARI